MLKTPWLYGAVCVFAVTAACGVSTPLSPVPDTSKTPSPGAVGATMKVTAPSLVSPINGETTASSSRGYIRTGRAPEPEVSESYQKSARRPTVDPDVG